MRVGFIGLGRMGLPMAGRAAAAGHTVVGFDVSPDARSRAQASGLEVVDAIGGLGDAEAVFTSLPDTPDVEQVYGGDGGVLDRVAPGTVCCDLSTIAVAASIGLAEQARAGGIHFLDTPVSGTSIHAEAGELVVMAGGEGRALDQVEPVLAAFARSVHHIGSNGSGLRLKLIINRLLTSHLAAIAEAVIDMETLGLDVDQGLEILRGGPVPKLLDYKADPLTKRDYTPQFTIDLMRKDLRLANDALPAARLAAVSQAILEEAAALGHGGDDLAALIEVVEGQTTEGAE
jgi:3-hydroxyisobutyrate dehydrogenase-like beta-hydroxyacid dehydrogenase